MARKFDGISNTATGNPRLDQTPFQIIFQLTIAYWLWWDSFSNGGQVALFYNPTYNTTGRGFYHWPNANVSPGGFQVALQDNTGLDWRDSFPRPSAGAWHHYVMVHNRGNGGSPSHAVWVDGVAQSLTTSIHHAGTYTGGFANSTLGLGSDIGPSGWGACRMAEMAIWERFTPTQTEIEALAQGELPHLVAPQNLWYYTPLWGSDSPEPDYSGNLYHVTLNGPTPFPHPRVRAGMFKRGYPLT